MNKRIQLSSSVPSVKPFEGKDLKNLKERKLNPIKKNDAEIVTSIVNRNQARLEKLNCLDNFAKIEPIQLSKENNFYANLNKSHSDYNTQEAIDRVNRLNQMDSNYSDNKMDQIILSVTKGHTEIESIKSVLFEIEKFINNLNSKHSEKLSNVTNEILKINNDYILRSEQICSTIVMLNDQFKNCRQKVSENSSQINGIASHFNHLNCNIDKILSNLNNNTKNISELTNEYSQLKLQIKNKLTEYKKSVETCYQSYDDNNKNLHQECMNLKKKYNDLENSLEKNVINTKEYLEKIDEKMDSYYNANDRKLSDERSILTNNFKELRNYANQQHKSSLENDDRTYKLFLTKLEEYDQKVKDDINNMESKNFKIEEELFNKIDTSTINKIQDLNYTYNSNFTKFSNIVSLLERQIDVQTNNFNELLAVEMNKRRRSEKNLSDINSNLEKQIIMATSVIESNVSRNKNQLHKYIDKLVDKQINTEKVILMKNESNLNHTNQRMKILEENYDQIIDEKNKLPNIYETIQSNNEKIHEKYQNEFNRMQTTFKKEINALTEKISNMNVKMYDLLNNNRNSKSNLIQIENESHLNQPVFQKESNEPVKSDESHEHFETGNEHISSAQIKSKTPSNESVSEYFESPSKKNFNKSNEINASNLESKDTQQYDLKNMENVNQFSSDIQNGRDSYDDTDNINNIDTENIHEKNSKPSFIEIENESQLNQPVFQKELYEPVKSDESHETFETKNEYIDSEKIKSKPASNQRLSVYNAPPVRRNYVQND